MPTLTLLLARFTRTAWPLFLPALGVTKFLFLFPTRTTQGDRIFRTTLSTYTYHLHLPLPYRVKDGATECGITFHRIHTRCGATKTATTASWRIRTRIRRIITF